MNEHYDLKNTLLKRLSYLKENSDSRLAKRLKLEKLERMITRLTSYSDKCHDCNDSLQELDKILDNPIDKLSGSDQALSKAYHIFLKKQTSHLQKQHNLVAEDYYVGLWMSLGMGIGISFGLLFNDLTIGLVIGMCVGIAIGAGLDANAKKQGKVI